MTAVMAGVYPALIVVLVVAAVAKARDVRAFAAIVDGYRILPGRTTLAAAVTIAAAEAAAALLLAFPAVRLWGAMAAALLFAVFLAAMASVLRRGLRVVCGCFMSGRLVGRRTMARTGLLLVFAVMTAAAPAAAFSAWHLVTSACCVGLVAAASYVRRPVHAGEAERPPGLKPGDRFRLAAGPRYGTDPTLYALVSANCGTCTGMLPAFRDAASKIGVVLVSAAGEEAMRAHLAAHGAADLPLVIDPDVYAANDIAWPPFTVITGEDGTVLAAGGTDTPQRLGTLLTSCTGPASRAARAPSRAGAP
ncbi:MauE/DoxX family redox-associated membrane protein [Spirillospora sp. NPDC047279]|uniref:peroxiredoxin family protein n=1 Tax=Spirillospora sp. NPDC047279 TaxID=3155478 RepID=UPI0033D31FCB